MRKSLLLIAVAATMFSSSTAFAGKSGEKCYQLGDFADVVRLTFGETQQVVGNWSTDDYFIPVSGTYEADASGAHHVSIVGTDSSGSFGGNMICAIDGVPGGNFTAQCSGGATGNFQSTSSPFQKIRCPKNPSDIKGTRGPISALGRH
jgi:hypothetical protein